MRGVIARTSSSASSSCATWTRSSGSSASSYPTPWSRSMFAGELAKPSSLSLGAFERATGAARRLPDLSRYVDAWHVMNVAVAPDHRRAGSRGRCSTGSSTITARDERRGYTLEVRVSNEGAIRLYERLGFEPRGIRRGYYTDNREDALIMWRDPVRPVEHAETAVILGIETSCDETAAALVTADGEIRSNIVSSQAELHARYGGVVPEIASRRHLELVAPVVAEALAEAGATLDDVERVAVTQGPGLIGALLVGLSAAKALAWARGLPLVPVDHLHGHVASLYLGPSRVEPPFLCLLASGGHTLLLDVRERARLRGPRHDARRRGRRGLRQGRAPARARLPGRGRRSTGSRATGDPDAFAFPVARVSPGSTSPSPGSRRRCSTRCATSARRARRAPRRPRRLATSARSSARSSSGREAARRRAGTARSPSSAASPRTRSCAPRFPAPASRRSRSAPTTRR